MDKPVKVYERIISPSIEVGGRVLLITPTTPEDKVTLTGYVTLVVESMGIFETENSVWVPVGST